MLYFRMGVSMLISLYTARIVLATLGDVDYGIYNIVGGSIAIFTFLNGALSGSASRHLTYDLGRGDMLQLSKTFSATVIVHLLLALIIVVLCETIGLWILEYKLIIPADRMYAAQWVYQISLISMVLSIIQVPYGAVVISHEKMNVYAYMSIIDIVLRLLLILFLQIISGDKLILWAIMTMCVSIIYAFINIAYCRFKFPETKLKLHRETPLYKKLFTYAWWDLIGNIAVMLQTQGINILLNMFYGPIVNAARAISTQVQGSLNQFASNFMIASKPQIIKLYAADKITEMMNLVYLSSCLAFYLSWCLTLPLCLEIDYVLKLWLGEFPKYTISFTILTLILGLILNIKSSRVSAIHATGNIKSTNLTVGIVLCLVFPISYVLLKMGFNPNSTLIATIGVTLLGEILAINILHKYINFSIMHYWIFVYGRCVLVAAISSVIPIFIHFCMRESFLRLVTVTIVSLICVGVTIYLIGFPRHMRDSLNLWILQLRSKFTEFSKSIFKRI